MQSHQSRERQKESVRPVNQSELAKLSFSQGVKHLSVDLDHVDCFQDTVIIKNVPRSIRQLCGSDALGLLRVLEKGCDAVELRRSFQKVAQSQPVDLVILDRYIEEICSGDSNLIFPLVRYLQIASKSHDVSCVPALDFLLQKEDQLVYVNLLSLFLSEIEARGGVPRSWRVLDGASRNDSVALALSSVVGEVYRLVSSSHKLSVTESARADNLHLVAKDFSIPNSSGQDFKLSCQAVFVNQTDLAVFSKRFQKLISFCWESLEGGGIFVLASRGGLEETGTLLRNLKSQGGVVSECFPSIIFHASIPSSNELITQLRAVAAHTCMSGQDESYPGNGGCFPSENMEEQVWQHQMHLIIASKPTPEGEKVRVGLLGGDSIIEVSSKARQKVALKVDLGQRNQGQGEWKPDAVIREICGCPGEMTANQICHLLDLFAENDVARYDKVLNKTLVALGIPRVLYYEWLGDENLIRREAKKNRNEPWQQARVRLLSRRYKAN